jgi:hypothetical protein
MTPDDDIQRLHQLLLELREEGYEVGPYREVREKALDGLVPSAHQIRGLWHGRRSRKAEIARALKLKKRQRVVA